MADYHFHNNAAFTYYTHSEKGKEDAALFLHPNSSPDFEGSSPGAEPNRDTCAHADRGRVAPLPQELCEGGREGKKERALCIAYARSVGADD